MSNPSLFRYSNISCLFSCTFNLCILIVAMFRYSIHSFFCIAFLSSIFSFLSFKFIVFCFLISFDNSISVSLLLLFIIVIYFHFHISPSFRYWFFFFSENIPIGFRQFTYLK